VLDGPQLVGRRGYEGWVVEEDVCLIELRESVVGWDLDMFKIHLRGHEVPSWIHVSSRGVELRDREEYLHHDRCQIDRREAADFVVIVGIENLLPDVLLCPYLRSHEKLNDGYVTVNSVSKVIINVLQNQAHKPFSSKVIFSPRLDD